MGSGFQHGYNTGVLNAPRVIIQNWIENVTSSEWENSYVSTIWSITVSIFCLGGLLGSCLSIMIADALGRKRGLWLNNILVFPGAIIEGCAKIVSSYKMLLVGRLFVGINAGLNSGLTILYIAEIAPVKIRGAVGTFYQLSITSTILLSQILGLENVLGTETLWPYLLGWIIIPAIIQILALSFCPESPRHLLVGKGLEAIAERELTRLRKTKEEVESEMEDLRLERENYKTLPKITLKDILTNRQFRRPLIISVVLMMGQQFSGINCVLYFSTTIFLMSHLSSTIAQYGTLGIGLTIVSMTIVALFLMDIAGRKTLLLVGFGGMCISTTFLTIALSLGHNDMVAAYSCICLLILNVGFFAIGPGAIPWLIAPELFNQRSRAFATGIATSVNWICNFIVGIAFLPLAEMWNANLFIVFIVLLGLFFLFTWKKVPETKNKKIEEITEMFM